MRGSRLLLLALLPAYGMLTLPLSDVIPQASPVLLYPNVVAIAILLTIGELRFDGGMPLTVFIASFVAAHLAFWLPAAHLADVVLERARKRRARRRR